MAMLMIMTMIWSDDDDHDYTKAPTLIVDCMYLFSVQVTNLRSCTKVAMDIITAHNFKKVWDVAGELRECDSLKQVDGEAMIEEWLQVRFFAVIKALCYFICKTKYVVI